MSGDEVFVLIASLVVAGLFWGVWNWQLVTVHQLLCRPGLRFLAALLPLACAALLFAVLQLWSAVDVRDDARYLLMYQTLGAAWVLATASLLPYFGYSLRDDVLERGNAAAAWAIGGALVALTLCFAGGNIGDGPGWWVVVFSAALSTAALFAVWLIFEALARPSLAITCDRDLAAGIRLAGLLIALGLILGRGVAGDWVSSAATVRDFAWRAWPVLPLVSVAVIAEKLVPRAERGIATAVLLGLPLALVYLGGAAAWLLLIGIGN